MGNIATGISRLAREGTFYMTHPKPIRLLNAWHNLEFALSINHTKIYQKTEFKKRGKRHMELYSRNFFFKTHYVSGKYLKVFKKAVYVVLV